jgi:glycine/D-amino acid oxidase-like deaminating enzyme
LGATLLPNTPVVEILAEGGAARGVRTPRGEIHAPIVVDAAGAWLRLVAASGGSTVKAVPTRHQLMVTAPLPEVRPNQPITRIIDANVYIRPEKGGLMLGGYEPDPVQYDMRDLPADFQIERLKLDLSVLHRLAESVATQFPVFRDVEVREYRGGLPTMTADGEHILGPAPGIAGLYVIGGCCVGGLTTAPALGELLAELITQGRPSIDLSFMAPSRPATGLAEDELRDLCRLRYAHHYWSPETMPRVASS